MADLITEIKEAVIDGFAESCSRKSSSRLWMQESTRKPY